MLAAGAHLNTRPPQSSHCTVHPRRTMQAAGPHRSATMHLEGRQAGRQAAGAHLGARPPLPSGCSPPGRARSHTWALQAGRQAWDVRREHESWMEEVQHPASPATITHAHGLRIVRGRIARAHTHLFCCPRTWCGCRWEAGGPADCTGGRRHGVRGQHPECVAPVTKEHSCAPKPSKAASKHVLPGS